MGCSRPSAPPNVLLIVIDTVRADHLSLYGYPRATSPNIEELAQRGMTYEQANSAAPYTRPSTASILTGQYPSVHGAITHTDSIAPNIPTLAERLQDAGYTTTGIHRNGNVSETFGFGRGFETYGTPDGPFVQRVRRDPERENIRYVSSLDDSLLAEMATPYLKEPETPFFLYLHLGGAHDPYSPPKSFPSFVDGTLTTVADQFYEQPLKPFRKTPPVLRRIELGQLEVSDQTREQMIALYDTEIAFADHQVGVLLRELEASGLSENTLVVVTADHGEEFWDHGGLGHGSSNFEEQLHVPLVIAGPGVKTRSIKEPVSLVDVMPTILDFVGVEAPPGLPGRSLADVLRSPRKTPAPRSVYAEGLRMITSRGEPFFFRSVRKGNSKLVLDFLQKRKLLFDLDYDPREAVNRVGEDRGAVQDLLEELTTIHRLNLDSEYLRPVAAVDVPEELDESLRALGYLGSADDSSATSSLFRRPLRVLDLEVGGFLGHELDGANYGSEIDFSSPGFSDEQLLYGWGRASQKNPARSMASSAAVRLQRQDGQSRWQVQGRLAGGQQAVPTLFRVEIPGFPSESKLLEPGVPFQMEGTLGSEDRFVRLNLRCGSSGDLAEPPRVDVPGACGVIEFIGLLP